jgi:glycosyltransferase involved in cell wall biosynthesis
VLVVTRIFPNAVEPLSCAFQRQQLRALSSRCEIEVLAAIPHVPGLQKVAPDLRVSKLRAVPEHDTIDGIPVSHPRVAYVPGGGSLLAPVNGPLYLAGLAPHLRRLRGKFDVVLGAYLFPDAWAAARLAELLGIPHVVKVHGTDVHVVSGWRTVQPFIRSALSKASGVVAVSRPQIERLLRLGAPPTRTWLVRNGVDRAVFAPRDRRQARLELGLPPSDKTVLFVGRLVREKGLVELTRAVEALDGVHLVVLGDGPMRPELQAAADRFGRVHMLGEVPLETVARAMSAADVVVLPSWGEGTPNVVLEALASGRPVVATRVGGIPDVVRDGVTGVLVSPRDADALAIGLRSALDRAWSEDALLEAAPPSWEHSAERLHSVLSAAVLPPDRLAA